MSWVITMGSEFYRIFHTKLSRSIFFIILLIPCVEVVQLLLVKLQSGHELYPPFSFFLSGSSRGHMTQALLLWFLPLFLLLLGSDNVIQDYRTGSQNIFISKYGKKKYFSYKLATSFLVSFFAMFISLLLNFILVSLFFMGGKNTKEYSLPDNLLFTLSIEHPYLAVIVFSLTACLLAGFAGLLGASFSLFFQDRKYSYSAAFFVWFFLVIRDDSLMYLFQPFAEYGFDTLLPVLATALAVFISIPALIYFYEVKFNDG